MAFSFGGMVEFINEENIFYGIIAVAFFMGVFASRFATRFIEVSHAARIAQSTIYRCLLMSEKIHEDMELLMELKHRYMKEAQADQQNISDLNEIDRKILADWRESIVQRMILYAPPAFSFIIKFSNWREAMQQLREMQPKE